jgi:DNA polymerase-3 subunit delta
MSKPPPLFYVLHGDDQFSLRAAVRAMRESMGEMGEFNTALIDGHAVSASAVLTAARMLPFLGDKRLVVVSGLLAWLGRKGAGKGAKAEVEALAEGVADLPDSARLVFAEPDILPEAHPLLKAASKPDARGHVRAFTPPRERDGKRWKTDWVRDWIVKRIEGYGAHIEPAAALKLAFQMADEDLYAVDSECAKLAAYLGPAAARPLTEADVVALTPYAPEADVFKIAECIAQSDGKGALLLIQRLLQDPREEPLRIFALIGRHFRQLLQARETLDTGGRLREVPDLERLPSFVLEKLSRQAGRFSLPQLEQVYRKLLETDYDIKMGKTDQYLALTLLVAALAGE